MTTSPRRIPFSVQRPGRYTGGEFGQLKKEGAFRIALAFPDVYEIGMSNLGMKILYAQLNRIPDVRCERVFSPWFDMEDHLKKTGRHLATLESGDPVRESHVLAFSVPHELSATNVLQVIDLSGISLRSERRGQDAPIVLAGGLGVCNPSVLSPFVDVFAMGEAEECIHRLVETLREGILSGGSRSTVLEALSHDPAVYIPLVHGHPSKAKPGLCHREWVKDLNRPELLPVQDVVPYLPVTQDRIPLEIMRGCSHGCRFCLAGFYYRPRRERDPELLRDALCAWIRNTGLGQVGLLSLSSSDYTRLSQLLDAIVPICSQEGIGVHLPSVRADSLSGDVLSRMNGLGRFSVTLAPEAATSRLRNSINKDIRDADLERVVSLASSMGRRSVKLYYMIGLPGETEEDRRELVSQLRQFTSKKGPQIHANLGLFVPKPHTPFQWSTFAGASALSEYLQELFESIKPLTRVRWSHASPPTSALEALLARGDESLSLPLETAYREGARFDGWTDHFKMDVWQEALKRFGIDLESPQPSKVQPGGDLPWHLLDTGVRESFLQEEFRRSQSFLLTPDCWLHSCQRCGLGCKGEDPTCDRSPLPTHSARSRPSAPLLKVRFRFERAPELSHVGHVDWTRAVGRLFRRAELPLVYGKGFSKRPRLAVGPPLPVGCYGTGEYVDLLLTEELSEEALRERVQSACPSGVGLISLKTIEMHTPSLDSSCRAMVYTFDEREGEKTREALATFNAVPCLEVSRVRNGDEKRVDLKSLVLWLRHEPIRHRVLVAGTWGTPGAFRPEEFYRAVLREEANGSGTLPKRLDLLGPCLRSISRTVGVQKR